LGKCILVFTLYVILKTQLVVLLLYKCIDKSIVVIIRIELVIVEREI